MNFPILASLDHAKLVQLIPTTDQFHSSDNLELDGNLSPSVEELTFVLQMCGTSALRLQPHLIVFKGDQALPATHCSPNFDEHLLNYEACKFAFCKHDVICISVPLRKSMLEFSFLKVSEAEETALERLQLVGASLLRL